MSVPLFTQEDDELLLKELHTHGRKWKLVAAKIGKHYTGVFVKYRVLLLMACKRINDCLDAGIDNEDPMNQNDDETTHEELSHHFDLQKSLKRMYDPNHRYNVRSRMVIVKRMELMMKLSEY